MRSTKPLVRGERIQRAIRDCPALKRYIQQTQGDLRAFVDQDQLAKKAA